MVGDGRIHKCSYVGCDSVFNRPYRLAQHLLVHQNVKQFCCTAENCGKSFTNNTHLKRHINSIHKKIAEVVIYSCPHCMKTFSNRQNLKRHMNIHEKQLCCDICKKAFLKKNILQAHIYTHTGVKPFSCEICSNEFVSNYEKNRHMRHHKTYNCDICDSKFQHWSKYQKHRKTEHDTLEFICDDCGRKFKKRSHIVRHVKIHYTTFKFECPYKGCDRIYSSKSNLNQHYSVKHDNFGYVCSICEAKFTCKASLKLHTEKVHNSVKNINQPPKRLATGRKPRKDTGTYKKSTAMKISGLAKLAPVEQTYEAPNVIVSETSAA